MSIASLFRSLSGKWVAMNKRVHASTKEGNKNLAPKSPKKKATPTTTFSPLQYTNTVAEQLPTDQIRRWGHTELRETPKNTKYEQR